MSPNALAERVRVAFVDDEPQVLRAFETFFFDNDAWDIVFFGGGDEALAAFEKSPPDVLVTDIRMPGMDGFQLLEVVSRRWPKAARVVVSGQFDEQRMLNSAGLAQQYLFKPCDPAELEKVVTALLATRDRLSGRALAQVVGGMTSIPTMPATYQKVMDLARRPDSSLREIGQVVAADVALTAKILQLVNSAYFGIRRQIVSAEEAAVFLGIEALKAMALAAKVFTDAENAGLAKGYVEALWEHSLLVATCSRAVAHAAGRDKVFADNAFSCGLLHDIGRVVFILNKHTEYKEYLLAVDEAYDASLETERKFFGTDHCEMGAYVLGLWGLPGVIVETILCSRDPREAKGSRDQATVLYMTNVFCHEFKRQRCFRHAVQWDDKLGDALLQKRIVSAWKALCRDVVTGSHSAGKGGVR